MVHAPVSDLLKHAATELDILSDQVDDVNILKLKNKAALAAAAEAQFDAPSKFDAEKDKSTFRQYETACDRVKNFYAVSRDTSLCVAHWQALGGCCPKVWPWDRP